MRLHPEKPLLSFVGPEFDSRHLHSRHSPGHQSGAMSIDKLVGADCHLRGATSVIDRRIKSSVGKIRSGTLAVREPRLS